MILLYVLPGLSSEAHLAWDSFLLPRLHLDSVPTAISPEGVLLVLLCRSCVIYFPSTFRRKSKQTNLRDTKGTRSLIYVRIPVPCRADGDCDSFLDSIPIRFTSNNVMRTSGDGGDGKGTMAEWEKKDQKEYTLCVWRN